MLEIPNFHLTCVKNSMITVSHSITVFTVNGLPDFIYLILARYQDWIKMHHVYELLKKITAAPILQASKQGTKYWPCTTQFCEFVPSSNILLLNKLGCLPHLKVSMAR
jgi:hypothetical protein